jgi:hypothetical protein
MIATILVVAGLGIVHGATARALVSSLRSSSWRTCPHVMHS